jgi:lactoylglutathione lyase
MCDCCSGKITGLGHIGVFVEDIDRSIKFYTEVLGFELYEKAEVPEDGGVTICAFIRNGSCVVELVQKPGAQPRTDGPVDHIAMAVDDVDAVMAHLKKHGIVFETDGPVHLPMIFDGVRFACFRGPDGEHLEICQVL